MEENKMEKKVMVAIDESECSHWALQWALENLGHAISASQLFIFNAQPLHNFAYLSASTYGAPPVDLINTVQENQKRLALALLEKAKGICANRGVDAETMTEVGDPKEKICEAVEKLNIELLILGSHGRGAIQRAFLGSVSNHCVHNAKCPVLVAITLKVTTTEFHFVGQTIAFGDELGEHVRKLGLFVNQ
ncbi:hypothetical protein ERO13_D04G137700v2 [Gossypium hirsutum]|uniref:Universal stress protein A-like protein isoform X1 n=4 Tax=Gossypium TaxID=3633 RepID=A0ABM2ZVN9_GOSHI|nr:universal stress protein A-like protein isoform X1 [Gossypium hirsutum]KAB2035533.1 hypothetical protein ES319_D04G158700v1 [Gossypium barbadense]KAG4152691.1 hypothetical protein ERO13_D04G137700v2 [Gossypium hirsutum]TYH77670.1 hypothetical protein ES332_D04G170500v1 [Gossypium tomentosum]